MVCCAECCSTRTLAQQTVCQPPSAGLKVARDEVYIMLLNMHNWVDSVGVYKECVCECKSMFVRSSRLRAKPREFARFPFPAENCLC